MRVKCKQEYTEKEKRISTNNRILEIAHSNNGVVTASQIAHEGISPGSLHYLVKKGRLEKSGRGVYSMPETLDDEMLILQTRYRKGIFSLDTALFLFDLTDRTPLQYCMTFPSRYNITNPKKDGIQCSQVKEDIYQLGITQINNPAGNRVYCYCIERTLCDILKPRNHTDIQITSEAFKRYAVSKNKNIPLLSEYAKLLNVEEKIRSYLEVLL